LNGISLYASNTEFSGEIRSHLGAVAAKRTPSR
jgi:hypothetical protein